MVEERKDDVTPVEYFVVGLVLLLFGLLYYWLNPGSAPLSTLDSAADSAPVVSTKLDPVESTRAVEQPAEKAVAKVNAEPTESSSEVKEEKAEPPKPEPIADKKMAAANLDLNSAKVSKLQAEEEWLRTETEKLQAEKEKLLLETEQLRAEKATLNNPPEVNVEPEPVVQAEPESEPVVEPVPESTPETEPVQAYRLPDGREVAIANTGFEAELESALVNDATDQALVFDAINFVSGSADIAPESQAQLEASAALLNTFNEARVLIRGHTDDVGSGSANSVLSLSRSNNLRKALVDLGIDRQRIEIEGVGPLEPIASNDSEQGRNINRRIEIMLIK